MHDDHGARPLAQGGTEDLARVDQREVQRALADARAALDAVLSIEQQREEGLALLPAQERDDQLPHAARRAQRRALRPAAELDAPAELERGAQTRCADGVDELCRFHMRTSPPRQTRQTDLAQRAFVDARTADELDELVLGVQQRFGFDRVLAVHLRKKRRSGIVQVARRSAGNACASRGWDARCSGFFCNEFSSVARNRCP